MFSCRYLQPHPKIGKKTDCSKKSTAVYTSFVINIIFFVINHNKALKPKRPYLFYLTVILLFLVNILSAQQSEEIKINGSFNNQPFTDFISLLEKDYELKVFYKTGWVESCNVTAQFNDTPLVQALNLVLSEQQLTWRFFQDDGILIYKKEYDQVNENSDSDQFKVVGNPLNIGRYKTAKLIGRVTDGATGEPLTGAVVFDPKSKKGTSTNASGQFEIQLPTGEHQLQFSFVGFENSLIKVKLIEDGFADFQIFEESHKIAEVTVLGVQSDLPRAQMSLVQMTSAEIKNLPALMGEVDILRGMTMRAGVQMVSELSPGYNVRGGNTDQNLLLVSGTPVFNASHLFGFLSLINPDVVNDVRLFKGGIPLQFGERVSSVMEVDFKEGNKDNVRVYGGIGLINSRLAIEGPMTKSKKITFVAGGRNSYTDWILKEIPDPNISQSVARFYDATGKITWKFDAHNKLSVMGYISNDEYSTSAQSVNKYGSVLGNLTLNNRFSESLYGELNLAHSRYKYQLTDYANNNQLESYYLRNNLNYSSAGYNFKWHISPRNNVNAGFKAVYSFVSPGEVEPMQSQTLIDYKKLNDERLFEWAVYAGDEFEVLPNFSITAGLRFSWAGNIGQPVVYFYNPDQPLDQANVTDSLLFAENEVSASYSGFEPRLMLSFDLNDYNTLKFNYQRVRQNIFQFSNSAVISPAETWKSIDYYLKPLISDQVAFVFENNSVLRNTTLAAELYFKYLQNLIEYKNGAQLLMNSHLETALIPTQGYSTGIELSATKSMGRLTGYAGYVFSLTRQKNTSKFEEENLWGGDYYRSLYDRPHDLTAAITYNISRRWRFSANFVFISGRPVTLPEIKYVFAGEQLIYYSERNKYRMPPYHRADVSITFDENLRKRRMWKGSWTLSVYNLYGRNNPYSVYYKKSLTTAANDYRLFSLYKLSVIGIPVPSLTYNFKF